MVADRSLHPEKDTLMKKIVSTVFVVILSLGTLLAPAQSAPGPKNIICDNTPATALSGTYKNVRVKPGDSCYLLDAHVTGNLHAKDPVTVKVIDSPVDHNIKVSGATQDVIIGHFNCKFDPVAGNNIMVKDSHNVAICWMSVGNNIKVSGNDGRINVHHNTVDNNISVTNNDAYVAQPLDGVHPDIDAIRFRHNTAGGHNTIRNNAGRPVLAGHNSPAIRG
jgi:hypothetical protein